MKKSTQLVFAAVFIFGWMTSSPINASVDGKSESDLIDATAEEAFQLGLESFDIDTPYAQENAEKWIRSAAERGHLNAQHHLAVLLDRGQFGEPVFTLEAQQWFVKAANAGNMLSQNTLGVQYFNGSALIEKDYDKARHWFELSAAQRGAYANLNLGMMYQNGLGVEANEAKALEYYRRSWDESDAATSFNEDPAIEGMWEYANILRYSNRVYHKQQHKLAVEILRFLAVDQGWPKAQVEYASALAHGIGIDQDENEAMQWYLKAANQGYAEAMKALAGMYWKGAGTEVDYVRSLRWAFKAWMF